MRRVTRRTGFGRSAWRTLARAWLVARASAGCSGRTPLGVAFAPDAAPAVERDAAHDAAPAPSDTAAVVRDASVDLVILGLDAGVDVAVIPPDEDGWGMRNYFSTGLTTDDAQVVWVTP
jgi:hypothetical protein